MLEDGGDRRSLGHNERVIRKIRSQRDFDLLFAMLFHKERLIVMRAADAIEKITAFKPAYLLKHKQELMELFYFASAPEVKWHMARLIIRLPLNPAQFAWVWHVLVKWVSDRSNSRLVRVAALQSLYEMTLRDPERLRACQSICKKLERENIPSVNARIRNIRRELRAA